MITVQEFTEAIDFKITGGSEFEWACFGPDARYLDSEDDGYSTSVIISGPERTVCVAELHDYQNSRSYRWLNPDYADAYRAECLEREVVEDDAWEDVKFNDVEAVDILEKIREVSQGNFEYDPRAMVPLTLPEDEIFQLMRMAHERDITLNQLVAEILTEAMKQHA